MLFSSIVFIAYFLPAFLVFYYTMGMRTAALLTGSVIFYVWGEGPYVALLAGLIALNHVVAHRIAKATPERAKIWLAGVIGTNLAVLALFKYAGFIAESVNSLVGATMLPVLDLRLPLGISFFTFQLISYVVDVHRREVQPERNPIAFATYILMFPHLIAGPIVRYADIRSELQQQGRHVRTGLGVQYFCVGLSQKVLIANSLAPVADHAFSLGGNLDATMAWLGALSYTLQIYFDFCGYSNMAIGLAFLLGFTFPKNFDYPYAAQSISDFWRRWHMSLSFWFRDYVYIPLGGNRGSQPRVLMNLLVVFFLTGLWHGAAWNFIVWGLFHGMFLLTERLGFNKVLQLLPRPVTVVYTMLVVTVGWVFFRAEDLTSAMFYLSKMADVTAFYEPLIESRVLMSAQFWLALGCGILLSLPTLPALMGRLRRPLYGCSSVIPEPRLDTLRVAVLPAPLLLAGLFLSIALLAGTSLNPFLYFRF
ncbi:MBOAT family O-acyltransferase [Lysobacter korlensis]|uniref:Probable alginate O-acetylase n=1 Tax=Lysobacter korlensis TaxID=553636 RepID=A0ABV6RIQ5_9GAMM